MLNQGFICQSANIEELDPEIQGANIALEHIDMPQINCVLSNSFGFGGTNACLVFKKHPA